MPGYVRHAGGGRRRIMRPYEWTHKDTRFREWLQSQGLAEDNWGPPTRDGGEEEGEGE